MSEGEAESGKQRPPFSQQGRSPRRQPQPQQQPPGSSAAAHQVASYIMPPHQQQQLQNSSASVGYNIYPPHQPHPGQIYRQHPSVGPLHGQQQPPLHYAAAAGMTGQLPPQTYTANTPAQRPMQHEPYIQPRVGRLPADRPIMKLSVGLIETYKQINQVSYYTMNYYSLS